MIAANRAFSQQPQLTKGVTDNIDGGSHRSDRIAILIAVHIRGRRKCSDNADALVERVLDTKTPRCSDGVGYET
jgi:hypothetical protein